MGKAAIIVVAIFAVLAAACSDPSRLAANDSGPATSDNAVVEDMLDGDGGKVLGPTITSPSSSTRPTTPPLPPPTTAPPPPDPVTVVAVGNLSDCGQRDGEVAALIDETEPIILSTGDISPDGSEQYLTECFLPLYGDDLDRFYTVAGNRDLATDNGDAFYDIVAQTPTGSDEGKGWFVTTIGAWQVIGLNSRCADIGGCDVGSEQYQWLDDVLREQPSECRLAIWHDPRFNSAANVNDDRDVGPLYGRLDGAGTDLLLTGGPANYERLGPLRPNGDPVDDGMLSINVGTGGYPVTPFSDVQPGTQARLFRWDGVLSLVLSADGYDFEFVATPESVARVGSSPDEAGSGTC